MRDAATKLVAASQRLQKIGGEYPQMKDLAAVLANSPAEQVARAATVFSDAVTDHKSETGEARIIRLRKLAGALRLQMGAMDNWMSTLNRTANLRVRDLSGVK